MKYGQQLTNKERNIMKKYKNYADNMKKRRILKKQGFENIKIKNGKIKSKARYEWPYYWDNFYKASL